MKQGLTLDGLQQELSAQRKASEDYVLSTEEATLLTPRGENGKGGGAPEIHLPEGLGEFTMTEHAQRQMSDRMGIPYKFFSRLRDDHPDLLDHDVNELMRREPQRRMIRTFDWSKVPGRESGGKIARAMLSDRYRRLDHFDLADAVFPEIGSIPGAKVESCDLTERRMYLKVTTPRVSGEVKKGDVVQAGLVISNSEVGSGSLSVQPMIFRLVCLNGMIGGEVTRKFHLGRAATADDSTYAVLSDEARQADDKALFLALRDVVRAACSETTFNALLAEMREAAGSPPMEAPIKGVERLAKRLELTDDERDGVLTHLLTDGDLTRWGCLNAVTRTAQDVESYDRATELEEAGAVILGMNPSEWTALAAA